MSGKYVQKDYREDGHIGNPHGLEPPRLGRLFPAGNCGKGSAVAVRRAPEGVAGRIGAVGMCMRQRSCVLDILPQGREQLMASMLMRQAFPGLVGRAQPRRTRAPFYRLVLLTGCCQESGRVCSWQLSRVGAPIRGAGSQVPRRRRLWLWLRTTTTVDKLGFGKRFSWPAQLLIGRALHPASSSPVGQGWARPA